MFAGEGFQCKAQAALEVPGSTSWWQGDNLALDFFLQECLLLLVFLLVTSFEKSDFLPTKRILENQCCFTCWSFSQNTGGQILSFELCSLQICFKCLKAEVEKIKLYFKIPENSWSAGPFCCGNHCLECSLPFL